MNAAQLSTFSVNGHLFGVEVAQEAFEEPPETLGGIARELIRGAYKLDHALLLSLDVQRAVDLPPLDNGSGVGARPM